MWKRDEQERKQDREIAHLIRLHELARISLFEGQIELDDTVADYAFRYYLALLEWKLSLLWAECHANYGFDLALNFNQLIDYRTATSRGEEGDSNIIRGCFTSELAWLCIASTPSLYSDLVAKIGEYNELANRRGILAIHRDCVEGTAAERFQEWQRQQRVYAASAWNNYCFAYCEIFGRSDSIPGMVESITKLTPFINSNLPGGNSLHEALSRGEDDPRETLWIELQHRLNADNLPNVRNDGAGIVDLLNTVTSAIRREAPKRQPHTVSFNMPTGEVERGLTLQDTFAHPDNPFRKADDRLMLAAAERELDRRANDGIKSKIKLTMDLDAQRFTDAEIAAMLGEPPATVKTRLRVERAKERARKKA